MIRTCLHFVALMVAAQGLALSEPLDRPIVPLDIAIPMNYDLALRFLETQGLADAFSAEIREAEEEKDLWARRQKQDVVSSIASVMDEALHPSRGSPLASKFFEQEIREGNFREIWNGWEEYLKIRERVQETPVSTNRKVEEVSQKLAEELKDPSLDLGPRLFDGASARLYPSISILAGGGGTNSGHGIGTAGVVARLGFGSKKFGSFGPEGGVIWSGRGYRSQLIDKQIIDYNRSGRVRDYEIFTETHRKTYGMQKFELFGLGYQTPWIAQRVAIAAGWRLGYAAFGRTDPRHRPGNQENLLGTRGLLSSQFRSHPDSRHPDRRHQGQVPVPRGEQLWSPGRHLL